MTITNDGATILKLLEVEHPAAKVLCELADLQDKEVGDGTTSVVRRKFYRQIHQKLVFCYHSAAFDLSVMNLDAMWINYTERKTLQLTEYKQVFKEAYRIKQLDLWFFRDASFHTQLVLWNGICLLQFHHVFFSFLEG